MLNNISLSAKKILGVNITISSKETILEEIQKYFKKPTIYNSQPITQKVKPFVIFTPNPEIITYAQKDSEFIRIVNTAQINLADGSGVVWALKKLYGLDAERIQGVDFMLKMVKIAHKESLRIGLIGGRRGLAVDTLECLRKMYPKLSGWAADGPEIKVQSSKLKIQNYDSELIIQEIVAKIIKEKTDILFVAMGFPKQEYVIDSIKYHVLSMKYDKPLVLMTVGGTFDYISGRVPRAPEFMRNLGLEWLFRLLVQPWRLQRQLKGAEFFWKVLNS